MAISNDEANDQSFVTRRSLIGGATAGAAALALGAALLPGSVFAQDEADDASALTPGEDATLPTGTEPVLPPEYTDFAADWPVFNNDITSKRVATSTITSENIGELGVAWTYSIESAGYYGTWTSPALIQGETVYVQDLASNVHALDRETGDVKWVTSYDVPTVGPNGIAVAYGMV
ncbi:MAG: twin-arginine translocation signal domain-containing protein, partial [Thermomicrobiales bacterium]